MRASRVEVVEVKRARGLRYSVRAGDVEYARVLGIGLAHVVAAAVEDHSERVNEALKALRPDVEGPGE